MVSCHASWRVVGGYVWNRMNILKEVGILTLIEDNEKAVSWINSLVDQGWAVVEKPIQSDGFQLTNIKRIYINSELRDYNRDITLLHEIVSTFYGDKIKDEIVVEWIARRIRADPKILRQAIRGFGLEERVHDKASYQAFNPYTCDLDRQLEFDFARGYFDRFKINIMAGKHYS
ncbi:hypothetical protein HYU23_01825 [Candidatus Woesearchaeota archaeon]|nr:hypothetical protein [Candidatus Woesearchaeota archaeon]